MTRRYKRTHKRRLKEYIPEPRLIQLVLDEKISWVDYVVHHSPEWREDFTDFCRERGMAMTNMNAKAYVAFREDLLEEAHRNGGV